MAFAIITPERRVRTKVRRANPLPIHLGRCLALGLNIAVWVVIWTVGSRLLGR